MTDIADAKSIIQEEESQFGAAVSEAYAFKVGASINFINNRQYDKHSWNINGFYKLGEGSSIDGIFPFLFDVELTGFYYFNGATGITGTTTIDVHWLSGGTVDEGTIFSTKPSVTTTAPSGSYTLYNQVTSTTISNPTGHTLAALSKVQFNAGDALRLDLDSAMSGATNFQFGIMFRPR